MTIEEARRRSEGVASAKVEARRWRRGAMRFVPGLDDLVERTAGYLDEWENEPLNAGYAAQCRKGDCDAIRASTPYATRYVEHCFDDDGVGHPVLLMFGGWLMKAFIQWAVMYLLRQRFETETPGPGASAP